MIAITFVRKRQVSIVSTKEELIGEINHHKAFWLSGVGDTYTNTEKTVEIKVHDLNEELRKWLSGRMK